MKVYKFAELCEQQKSDVYNTSIFYPIKQMSNNLHNPNKMSKFAYQN